MLLIIKRSFLQQSKCSLLTVGTLRKALSVANLDLHNFRIVIVRSHNAFIIRNDYEYK